MILRELLAKFGVAYDDSGARKADKDVEGLSSGFKALIGLVGGAALVRGFGNFLVQQVQLADAIGDTAERLGIGVEALQELRFAGQDVGMSLEGVDGALGRLVRGAAEAARGQGEAKDAFRELGVQLTDSQGNLLGFDAIMAQVAEGMGGAATDADRLRLGYELFGREGSKMAATMKGGAAGMEAMRQRARELGGVLSIEQVEAADKADKAIAGFGLALGGLKHQIAAYFIPALTTGLTKLAQWVTPLRELIRNSHIVEAGLIAVGAALSVMLGGARLLMLTKAGLAFIAIALAVDDIITFAKGGDSAIGRLIDSFGGLGASVVALESWKVGLRILIEQSKEWLANLQAGFKIMAESRAAVKKEQLEAEIKDWERRKRDEENQPAWMPDWMRVSAGPRPGSAGEHDALEELRTRQVSQVRGMGYGPLLPEVAGQSAEDIAAQRRGLPPPSAVRAEAVAAVRSAGASGPVNVQQTMNVNVTGTGDPNELARTFERVARKVQAESNAEALFALRQSVPQ